MFVFLQKKLKPTTTRLKRKSTNFAFDIQGKVSSVHTPPMDVGGLQSFREEIAERGNSLPTAILE